MLLAQYRAFWSSLAAVSRMPATQRREALSKVAVDPALRSVVVGMEKLDHKGEVLYGADIPRPKPHVALNGMTAVLDDCQDSTNAGAARRGTMTPVTVGVARNHVVVTMKTVANGSWKIAFISYTKTPC